MLSTTLVTCNNVSCGQASVDDSMPTTSQAADTADTTFVRRSIKIKTCTHTTTQFRELPSTKQRSQLRKLSTTSKYSLNLLITFMLLTSVSQAWARSVVSAKCYFFGPGTTIHGADYRRDFGLERKECAEQCKADVCCMGFEWLDGRCTLKSRSLNGIITAEPGAYFGLCLDLDDSERDRFWDHELGGSVVSSKEKINRESCIKQCNYKDDAIIYSWRALDEKSSEEIGDCSCIGVLHSIKLSFGSAAGFLM